MTPENLRRMGRIALIVVIGSVGISAALILHLVGVTYPHVFFLFWISFILSAGFACGFVAWKTWRLRKQHRIFHYFGMVKTALCISTLNSSFGLVMLIRANGFGVFDNLSFAQYRGLLASTGVAVTLWLLALYLLNKINGSWGGR